MTGSDHTRPLSEASVDPDPLRQFSAWFEDARGIGLRMPDGMALATATPDGSPSARMVLLKGVDERGFRFFTNYDSRKGRELDANPRAALLFYWDQLGRQVRVEGPVERISAEETGEYVRTRPRGSRLSALASRQSEVVASRDELERAVAELRERYGEEGELPIAGNWGGYRLRPEAVEFWQNREDRLHDRLRYRREGDGWKLERLSP